MTQNGTSTAVTVRSTDLCNKKKMASNVFIIGVSSSV